MLTSGRPAPDDGLSVLEVVLAATIVLTALLATARATASAVAAQGRAAARDRALAASYDVGDALQAEGCLFVTGAELPDDRSRVEARCRAVLRLSAPYGVGTGWFDGPRERYEVSYSSRWIGGAPATGPGCDDPVYAQRPVGVERRLELGYRERTARRSRIRVTAVDALPGDEHQHLSAQRSNLVVATTPGAVVELSAASGGAVARIADPTGCAWFPSLRSGDYAVRTNGVSTPVPFVARPGAAQVVTP